jgi:hypothetical protein
MVAFPRPSLVGGCIAGRKTCGRTALGGRFASRCDRSALPFGAGYRAAVRERLRTGAGDAAGGLARRGDQKPLLPDGRPCAAGDERRSRHRCFRWDRSQPRGGRHQRRGSPSPCGDGRPTRQSGVVAHVRCPAHGPHFSGKTRNRPDAQRRPAEPRDVRCAVGRGEIPSGPRHRAFISGGKSG